MSDLNLDWLISVDDHVIEPADVWTSRLPAKYRDVGPRMVTDDTGEHWVYEDKKVATLGLTITAGRERREFTPEPLSYADARPGCYDSVARLDDMNEAGILASLCFPSFPRFCGQIFTEAKDRELGLLGVRAYNDFMIDEWCGNAPGRFIPNIILPLWDARLAATEVERCAAKGAKALCFSENPGDLGLPTVNDPDEHWDPLWDVCNDTGIVVCMHIGSSSNTLRFSKQIPIIANMAWAAPAKIAGCMLDWLISPTLQEYPNLKIALSEGGIGWMPYFLERLSQVIDKQRHWASEHDILVDAGAMTTQIVERNTLNLFEFDLYQTFRDHVFGCFIDDHYGAQNLDLIGIDNVMAETDYPHSDSTWPNCIGHMRKQLAHLSDADTYKVLRSNAERVFNFTPAPIPQLDAR